LEPLITDTAKEADMAVPESQRVSDQGCHAMRLTLLSASAFFPVILVIRGWKKHGGNDTCVPPLPGLP